jgi:HEAT repeat protein
VLEPLAAFLPAAGLDGRLAALEVLERLEDRAALPRILDLARDDRDEVALRALEALGSRLDPRAVAPLSRLLAGPASAPRRRGAALALARLQAGGLVEALDPLAVRLLDEREAAGLRIAILEALLGLEPPLARASLRPLLERLASSAEPELAARAASAGRLPGRSRGPREIDERLVAELVAPGLSTGRASRIVAALARRGAPAIPALQRALGRLGPLRGRRADAASLRARAAVHRALAALDSRVALYDLREALEACPHAALTALLPAAARIGDASLVPALASAVSREPALLEPGAQALAAIARREKLRRKSAVRKAVRPEHRAAFDLLWEKARASRPG